MEIINNYLDILKEDFKNKRMYKHIPNLLTFIRLLSPLFIIPLFLYNKYRLAFILVIVSAITDIFDGLIARKFNLTSEFGRLLDAVTDKVFSLSLLIPLIKISNLYIVLIILEIAIGISNYLAHYKNRKPQTHYIGKIKTVVEFIFIALCYLSFVSSIDINILNVVFVINIILELMTLSIYVVKNKQSN